MDDVLWAIVLVVLVACFWAGVMFFLGLALAAVAVAVVLLGGPLLAGIIDGFRRERKARDSNPEGN